MNRCFLSVFEMGTRPSFCVQSECGWTFPENSSLGDSAFWIICVLKCVDVLCALLVDRSSEPVQLCTSFALSCDGMNVLNVPNSTLSFPGIPCTICDVARDLRK